MVAVNQAHVRITAEDKTKAAFASATRNLEVFNSRADGITTALSGVARFGAAGGALVAFGAAAAVSGGAMLAAAKNAINLADGLNDLSQKTGISVEQLAGLRIVAEQSGTSLDTVGRGIKNLQIALVDAAAGQGENLGLLKQLGLVGLSANDAFIKLADTFRNLSSEDEQTRLATALFKKGGQDLIPVLNQGTEALRRQIEVGKVYSGITTTMAKQSDEFNDQIRLLKANLEGVGVSIASSVLPGLNLFLERINKAKEVTGSFFGGPKNIFQDPSDLLSQTTRQLESAAKRLDKAQSNLATRPSSQEDRIRVDKQVIENIKQEIVLLEQRKKITQFFIDNKVRDDPLLSQGKALSELTFDGATAPVKKLDFGKDKKKRGKSQGEEFADELKKLQTEASRLDFVIKNFAELSKTGSDAELALAEFEITAGRFKGVPGADKLRKAASDIEAGRLEVEALKSALDQTTETNKLNFLIEAFEELGPSVLDSSEALAEFQVQSKGLENTRAGEKLVQSAQALDAAKKAFSITEEISRITEESRKLSFTAEQLDKVGDSALDSQESLALFRVQAEGLAGTELGDALVDAAKAFDRFKASVNAKQELSALNQDIEATIKRIADIETFGEVNPFDVNLRQAQRLTEGPLRNAPQEDRINVNVAGAQQDILARREAVSQFVADQQRANEEIRFQTSLIGLSAQEQERLTELRRIDLEVQRLSTGATGEELTQIRARGDELKRATAGVLETNRNVQRSFEAGWSEAFNSYVEDATDSAALARDAFQNTVGALKGGISDALSGDFKNIEDRFKATLDQMVVDFLATQAIIAGGRALSGAGDFARDILGTGRGDSGSGLSGFIGGFLGSGKSKSPAAPSSGIGAEELSGAGDLGALDLQGFTDTTQTANAGLSEFSGVLSASTVSADALNNSFSALGGLDLLGPLAGFATSTVAATAGQQTLATTVPTTIAAMQTLAVATTQAAAQIAAAGALVSAGGRGFAKGGVFQQGAVVSTYSQGGAFSYGLEREIKPDVAFATGGLVTQPTLFPMANGRTGLMGEDGAEAIMPLARSPGGRFGVHGVGEDNKPKILPLIRDASGRLAVKAFAAGGLFRSGREESLQGVLNSEDIERALPTLLSDKSLNTGPRSSVYNVAVNIASPDPASFRRSQAALVNQLNAALNAATARR